MAPSTKTLGGRLVVIDAPGPVRNALVQVLEALLPVKVEARPTAPDRPARAILGHLESHHAAIRGVILRGPGAVAELHLARPCRGFDVLKEIVRGNLLGFSVLLLEEVLPAEQGPAGDGWVPAKEFLEAAGYASFAPLAGISGLLGAAAAALAGAVPPGRERAFRHVQEALLKEDQLAFDAYAHTLRHQLSNGRAAARLLFGAYAMGEIAPDALDLALRALEKHEAGGRLARPEDLSKLQEIRSRLALHERGERLAVRVGADERVLVVDDQWEEAGWGAFFQAVFDNKTCHARDHKQALEILEQEGDRLALVCLDLCLPVSPDQAPPYRPEQGLELLSKIKHARLDLPVLVFSGMDQIRYARMAVSRGAANYYVKQLAGDDRSSVDYFQKFKEVVVDSLVSPDWRRIWKRIQALARRPPAVNEDLLKATLYQLRRAYYFLTADAHDPRARLIFEDDLMGEANVYTQCYIECGKAAEQTVTTLYETVPGGSPVSAPGVSRRGAEDRATFRQMVLDLKGRRRPDGKPVLSEALSQLVLQIRDKRNDFAHPAEGRAAPPRLSVKDACAVLEDMLTVAEGIVVGT